ncbi:high affinity cGMP-specific 3',5'-cyclic phosphodiesterase 9A isoform X2 [Drosophila ficusphila]|uniref:high affinity cGMP-specific 3',5'-cyclic phosphodiesterase 9A isoform X2 n=1 Tax=Drosophila ficusphila TaxID=30025 RepID=UPI0007E66653|nr:high affinity cGMP-specific 3',5'-cyclic phosphodiesterase 9A isoform X2 [Drosophila ficusphila]
MYQDSGCSSSSSRRGSSSAAAAAATAAAATSTAAAATATTTAAAATTTAATTTTAAATTTSSSDEETLETLTIITTTITDSDIHATTTTTTVIASGTATTAATATLATLATLATAAAATAVAATGATGVATGATGAAATAATATASSDIEDSSLVESEESEECEYIEIDCQTTTAQEGTSPSGGSSSSGNAVLLQRSSNNHRHQQQQQQQQHHQQEQQQQLQLQLQQADVRLLRKIGYIASRVRCLAKFYGDFRLVNPYSARRQRRQLQEILLRHSIFDPGKEHQRAIVLAAATAAIAGPLAAIDCACGSSSISLEAVSSRSRSSELEEERHEDEEEEDRQEQEQQQQKEDHQQLQELKEQVLKDHQHLEEGDPPPPAIAVTTTTATTTVRRKSSTSSTISGTATVSGSVSVSASASQSFCSNNINLLEELLIQFYEEQDHRGNLTVIRHHHHHHQQQQQQQHQQQQQQQRITNNNNNNNCNSIQNNNNMSNPVAAVAAPVAAATQVATSAGGGGASTGATLDQPATSSGTSCTTTTTSATQHHLQPTQLPDGSDNNPRRRRASDCSAVQAALQNQLHCITLKNNNCGKALPFHRGSCGAAGEHLLAANSIANRATIILSKSCSNVDGDGATTALSPAGFGGNKMRASATDIESNAMNGARDVMVASNNGNGNGNNGNNGNNEYSILQLNNTIIQCHFNDGDFRALVKDLKRKVEYTERMNWLCLSKRPMGPPHRKSSLPKHQEVKRRFLEICDTTFSEEVRAALRLPAFDSYEWGDADVIHLMQTMFVELGFIEKFSIPVDTLREWLYEVYKHYNEVPFHNFRHCFCVAQMMYAITRQANLLSRLGDLECLILLVSCICHDLDHPGYNNIYQINARTELALRYNDISPLENHHCSIAFRLLEHPECNIFKNFSRDTFNNIREGIIRCILATDMARHNEILTQFIEITPVFDYSNRAHINLLCMILIKVADISNEARPMDVAEPWLDRLLQEFFAQSAAEKSEGLPVTPFMDPDKVSKPGSQVRFIGLVLLPLFEALGELVPELTDLIIIPVRIALEYYRWPRRRPSSRWTRRAAATGASPRTRPPASPRARSDPR